MKYLGILFSFAIISACSHVKTDSISNDSYSLSLSASKGKRLTMMMCGGCHYNHNDDALTGKRLTDLPWYVGKVYSSNITDLKSGDRAYTDSQLSALIQHGVLLDGSVSMFMGTPQISQNDLESVVTYLRSNDRFVQANDVERPKTKLSIFAKAYFWFTKENDVSEPNDKIKNENEFVKTSNIDNGKYLVSILECYACHSSAITKINRQSPEDTPGYMTGGASFITKGGIKIRSADITANLETGIGGWNLSQFSKAMREGKSPSGGKLRIPMPKYTGLSDPELADIFSYLQSLPIKTLKPDGI